MITFRIWWTTWKLVGKNEALWFHCNKDSWSLGDCLVKTWFENQLFQLQMSLQHDTYWEIQKQPSNMRFLLKDKETENILQTRCSTWLLKCYKYEYKGHTWCQPTQNYSDKWKICSIFPSQNSTGKTGSSMSPAFWL